VSCARFAAVLQHLQRHGRGAERQSHADDDRGRHRQPARHRARRAQPRARGLHSSTYRLNVSASCGIGDALRVIEGLLRGC